MGIVTGNDLHIELGIGILGWPPSERETQRYGIVTLWTEGDDHPLSIIYKKPRRIELLVIKVPGKNVFGDLIATVVGARPVVCGIDPIGGFKPRPISQGSQVTLGRGILVFPDNKSVSISPRPDQMRPTKWMKPKNLFRVVDQLVRLSFIPNPT